MKKIWVISVIFLFSLSGCSRVKNLGTTVGNKISTGVQQVRNFGAKYFCEKARTYEQTHQWQEAIRKYSSVVKYFPKSDYAPEAQHRKGEIFFYELKNFSKAKKAYEVVVFKYPGTKWARKARKEIGKGELEEEIEDTTRILVLGLLALQKGETSKEVKKSVSRTKRALPELFYQYLTEHSAKRLNGIIKRLGLTYSLVPRLSAILKNAKRAAVHRIREEKAERVKIAARKRAAATKLGHYKRGNRYLKQGKPRAAIEEFKLALQLAGDLSDAKIYNKLGEARLKLYQYDSAIREFQRALRFDPGLGSARQNLAEARKLKKKYMAKENNKLGKEYLVKGAGNIDNINSAMECFKVALKYNPGFKQAEKNLERAKSAQRKYWSLYYHKKGVGWMVQKEYDLAIENFEKSLRYDPLFKDAKEDLDIAKDLKKGKRPGRR